MRRRKPKLEGRELLLDTLMKLHAEMHDLIIAAGVIESHYNNPVKDLNGMTSEQLTQLLDWLQVLRNNEYKQVEVIWKSKPTEWWTNMRMLFAQRNTLEEKLLRQANHKLRKAWFSRESLKNKNQANSP